MKYKLIFLSLYLLSFNASAALIDNGLTTTDDNTGLIWLDLTQTLGLSYEYVISETAAGGQFDGYRVATKDEFSNFIAAYYGNQDLWYYWADNGIANTLTGSMFDSPELDELTTGTVYTGVVYPNGTAISNGGLYNITDSGTFQATALVSTVPIPASIWLLSSGLLGLLVLFRKI